MIRLECTTGGHNKYYELHFSRGNERYVVEGLYGAIGQAPKKALIYDGDNEQEAVAEMQKKQLEKQKKGYVIVGSGGASSTIPVQKKRTISPQSGR
jgi:predicted DNA-binding WGR domain protein